MPSCTIVLIRQKLAAIKLVFLLISGAFLAASTAVVNGFWGLAFLLTLLSSRWVDWRYLARNPVAIASVGFFLLLGLGVLYSTAPLGEALDVWYKYRQLFCLPLLLLLFQHPLAQRWGETVFLLGLGAILLFSYLGAWNLVVIYADTPAIPAKNRITQSILLALGIYLCLNQLRHQTWANYQRLLCIGFILLAMANIIFITAGRSGYVILAALLLLWVWQGGHQRRAPLTALAVLLIIASFSLSYHFSSSLQQRVDESVYALSSPDTSVSSSSLRLEFLQNTWQLLQQQPWLGSGTGSFAHEYQLAFATTWTVASDNPHNEYLLLWQQLGLIGLLLLPVFLLVIWRQSDSLSAAERDKIQALVLMLAIGCLFNSLLLDFTEMSVFIYLVAHGLQTGTHQNPIGEMT